MGTKEYWDKRNFDAKEAAKAQDHEAKENAKTQDHEFRMEQAKKGVFATAPTFDLRNAERSVPRFDEASVDVFFDAFENVATELEWPRERWALLVQRALTGQAQQAYAALDHAAARNYDTLKDAVLAAYGSVPDEHRKKFRTHQRGTGESYLEVYRFQKTLMTRWLTAIQAKTVEEVKEAVLLEQFCRVLPRELELYVAERAPKTAKEAAELADSWEVIHYGLTGRGGPVRTVEEDKPPFSDHDGDPGPKGAPW